MSLKYWLALGSLSTAGLGIAYYLHEKTKTDDSVPAVMESLPVNSEGSPLMKTELRSNGKFNEYDYHFQPGNAYEITFKRAITGEAQKEPNQVKTFGESKASGKVVVHAIQFENNKVYVAAQYFLDTLSSPLLNFSIAHEFGVMKSGTEEATSVEKPKLKNTLLFVLSPTGRILKTMKASSMGMSNEGVFITSDILSATLFPFPENMPAANGNKSIRQLRDEKNTTYDMEFKLTKLKPTEVLIEGRTEVLPPKQKPGAPDIGFYVRTTRDLKVNWNHDTGVPNSLSSNASQEVKIQNQVIASGYSSLESTWKSAGKSAFIKEDIALFDTVVDLDVIRARFQAKNDQKSKEMSTWSKVKDALSKVGSMTEDEQNLAFNSMSEYLKKHPEQISQFKFEALNSPPNSKEINMLVGAIGSLGGPDSQKAMLEIYQQKDATQDLKEKIMTELALSPGALETETKDFLKSAYRDPGNETLASQAGYALGASLNHETDKTLIQEIKNDFQSASTTEKKVYMLEVMGNDRKEDFKAEIASAAGSKDPVLKKAAADALRFASEDQTRNRLFDLAGDSNPEVRASALHSMMYQPYDTRTFTALSSCVNSDSNSNVRAACYEVLCNHLSDPNTVSLLRSRSASEPDEGLKMKLQRIFAD